MKNEMEEDRKVEYDLGRIQVKETVVVERRKID